MADLYVVWTDTAVWAVQAVTKEQAHRAVKHHQSGAIIDERKTEKVNALKVIKTFDPGDVGIY